MPIDLPLALVREIVDRAVVMAVKAGEAEVHRVIGQRTMAEMPFAEERPPRIAGARQHVGDRLLLRIEPEVAPRCDRIAHDAEPVRIAARSEAHPSETQSLMRISYAVFGMN